MAGARKTCNGKVSATDVIMVVKKCNRRVAAITLKRLQDEERVPKLEMVVFDSTSQGAVTKRGGNRRSEAAADAHELQLVLRELPGVRVSLQNSVTIVEVRTNSKALGRLDDLYVMQYDFDDTRVKIGRSRDVEKRKRSLEASQDFQVVIRRVFHGKGPYEVVLHRALRKFRSKRGPGKEWFRLSSQEAERCISKTLLRRRLWSMRRSGRRPFSRSACLTPRRQPCKDEFLKSRESAKLSAAPVSSHAPEEEFRSCTRSGYP